jgi:hypothetical protein
MVSLIDGDMQEVDKKWTRAEISKQIGDLPISELRAVADKLSLQITALTTQFARLEGRLDGSGNRASRHPLVVTLVSISATVFVGFQTWLAVTLVQHGNALAGMRASMVQLGIAVAANDPTNPKSQSEAKVALAEARKLPKPISRQSIRAAGESFIEAAKTAPKAWDVALDFVSYQSSLNLPILHQRPWMLLSKSPNPSPEEIKGKPGDTTAYITDETAPCTDGAMQVHHTHTPSVTVFMTGPPSDTCAAYLRFVGGEVIMDGSHYVNTIFENMHITYRGGPVRLDNVSFVNCTFELPQPTPETMRLASAVLDSTQVTLTSPKG